MRITNLLKALMMLLPLLEIAGFIVVGSWIGVLPTLLLIIATTALGLFVLRFQGFITLRKMQMDLAAGKQPTGNALDSAMLMLGGLLLVIPGFITDTLGILLLIPATRILIMRWLIRAGTITTVTKKRRKSANDHIIEGEFHREDD